MIASDIVPQRLQGNIDVGEEHLKYTTERMFETKLNLFR
jgi:hypothetical protein